MIYILWWTTKKHRKTLSRSLHSKMKKIQGLAQKFREFSRKNKIQGLFKESPYNSRTFQDCANPSKVTTPNSLTMKKQFQVFFSVTVFLSDLSSSSFFSSLSWTVSKSFKSRPSFNNVESFLDKSCQKKQRSTVTIKALRPRQNVELFMTRAKLSELSSRKFRHRLS